MRLQDLAERYGTDKAEHGYCEAYERHLTNPSRLLEIGVHKGGSLRMWGHWLPFSEIVGVDIAPVKTVDDRNITTVVSDFRDLPESEWDVVIDDGSHNIDDVIAAWRQFWPQVRPGGWYVIEDLAQGGFSVLEEITRSWRLPGEIAEMHIYPSENPGRFDVNQAWHILFVRKVANV